MRNRRCHRLVFPLALSLMALTPGDALAKPDPGSTEALHRQATRALKAGKLPRAAAGFERFLAAAGDNVGGFAAWKRKDKAKKQLAKLRARLGRLTLKCDVDGAEVLVKGKPRGEPPLEYPLYFKPGRYRLELRKQGHVSVTRRLRLKRGEHQALEIALPLLAKVAPAPARVAARPAPAKEATSTSRPTDIAQPRPADPPLYKRWWFWTAVGVAAVVTGVTAG